MSPSESHRCTVQVQGDGTPYLAFEPANGQISSYSNSLFTLDLKPGVTIAEASQLCEAINAHLLGVSSTVF